MDKKIKEESLQILENIFKQLDELDIKGLKNAQVAINVAAGVQRIYEIIYPLEVDESIEIDNTIKKEDSK